jgi:hypothetical protein
MRTVNTLRDSVDDEPPNLDEFDGMSIVDIAHNIVNWPEGSEEQARAIAAIAARAPGIGHNRPPLADQLAIDTTSLRSDVDTLIAVAETTLIIDDESAGKVNDMVQRLVAKGREVEAARKQRNEPYAKAVTLVNSTYGALAQMLRIAHVGTDERGGLRAMLTKWDDKKRADAEAARKVAEEEQRKREEAAAEAQRLADEARQHDDIAGAIAADIRAASLADRAEQSARRAEAIRPEPIRSQLGSTTRQRVIVFTIDNTIAAINWALATPGIGESVKEDLHARIGSYLRSRAVGVAGVERGVSIPGITAKVELGQVSSRRP